MSGDLMHVRLTPGARPGETTRVERVAREGLAREVLVGRALPLLRRARRLLDEIADPDKGAPAPAWARYRAEVLADAVADLIGHSTTDSPPAPELEAVLAEGTPCRLTWDAWQTLSEDARAQVPATALPLELAVETRAEREARYAGIDEALERLGIAVKIPLCPMAPYAHADPEGRPPGDPRYCAEGCIHVDPESSDPAPREKDTGCRGCVDGCRVCDARALTESSEPAAPVAETPAARAARLDQERNTAQKAYARAVYAADEAWRAIGGRP